MASFGQCLQVPIRLHLMLHWVPRLGTVTDHCHVVLYCSHLGKPISRKWSEPFVILQPYMEPNQKSGFIHRLHSPTPTAIFSRHVVQNSLKYCRNVHPNCHTLPTASAVWMFCCADIQTTNKRRGMQQDLRCSIPSQLHALREQNKAHFRPRITMVPRTAAPHGPVHHPQWDER